MEAYSLDLRCTPQAGMGKNLAATQSLELGGMRKVMFSCVSLERSNRSFIGTRKGSEHAAARGEEKEGDRMNKQLLKSVVFVFNLH